MRPTIVCRCLLLFFLVGVPLQAEPARGERAMVATVHPLATEAGIRTLREGGSAVDAAVAAALTLGVVDGHNSGIGGGCFILIRTPRGEFAAIDGREMAPAKATRDMFIQDGKPRGDWSTTGPLAVAAPGALAAYDLALRKYGKKPIADLLRPAADVAERGFPLDRVFAGNLRSQAAVLARFEGSRSLLLKPAGEPYVEGEHVQLPDLARTYRAVADEGLPWFYGGPFAQRVGAWMAEHGGLLSHEDFASYQPRTRQPLETTYRDLQIVGFPPPSSGGVHVAEILNILQHFELAALHQRDPVQFVHVVAEAMKLAFADRAFWLGDPDFAKVPRGLVDPAYARELAQSIRLDRVATDAQHGTPPDAETRFFGHTTHVAAADSDGWWVGITATVNTSFGSKVVVPGTGVVLNNQMDDFSLQPNVPNAFGLVGAEANAVAPGKRPLSSMSPTMVLRDGQPVLTVGAAGGPTIISQVVLAIVNHVDLGLPLDAAVARPRFHHQWSPNRLIVERSFPEPWRESLRKLGHEIQQRDSMGVTQAIGATDVLGGFIGVHDPRVPGRAASPSTK